MSLISDARMNYLLTRDMAIKVQRWWRNVAPSIRDTYKCPVCINMHPVSRAVAGFSCNHIMCSACYEAWERQCSRNNRSSTCPSCRAGRISPRPDRDDYDRTMNDIWISSPAATVTEEIVRNALQNTYMNSDGYLQDDMMIHHAPTIRRMMRDTQRIPLVHTNPHSIIRDIEEFVSMQISGGNITSTPGYSAIQRAAMRSDIDISSPLGHY